MHAKLVALGTSVLLFLAAASGSVAQRSDIQIKDAWARATPTGAKTAAAYISLTSAASDRLTGASTPVAQKAELHTMSMEGSVMKMRQVDGTRLWPIEEWNDPLISGIGWVSSSSRLRAASTSSPTMQAAAPPRIEW